MSGTQLKELNDLKEQLAKLQQEHDSMAYFLRHMSHELRTPLTAILGYAQLCEMEDNLPTAAKPHLHEILNGSHTLLNLVNQLLLAAKIEGQGLEYQPESCEWQNILAAAVDANRELSKRYGIQIEVIVTESPSPAAFIETDPALLEQIFSALISNGIKFNRRNGVLQIKAEITTEQRLQFSFIDQGRGISRENSKAIYLPYERLGVHGVPGTGLGLYICHHLLTMLGTPLSHHPNPEAKGTCFSFSLTLNQGHRLNETNRGSAQLSISPPVQRMAAEKGHFTILYIEDNEINMKLVRRLLSPMKRDITLLEAIHPHQGLEMVREHHPDLILLDLHLPDMDGYQLNQHLKTDISTAMIPVVAVSASAMPHDIKRGMENGFFDYITKPIDIPRFMTVLERIRGHTLSA